MKISQKSGVPIYQQIADQLRQDILAGKFSSGEYLPSIRGLARDLSISVITTMKAYETLEKEGYITAVQGKGFVVNDQNSDMLMEQHARKIEEYLLSAIAEAKVAGISEKELMNTLKVLINL